MLDQNTDRMWYVIGAVIVGAALIFLMNSSFPTLFASIGDSFDEKTEDVAYITDGIMPVKRPNLLREYVIRNHHEGAGRVDVSKYESDNVIYFEKRMDEGHTQWGGMYLKMDELNLEPHTTYRMEYQLQKTDGVLETIGGHTDSAFDDNIWYLDGKKMDRPYDLGPASEIERFLDDDDAVHTVRVDFTTPVEYDPSLDLYDGRISIQPNRGVTTDIAATITNLTLTKITSH